MENGKRWFTCHYAAKETGLSQQLITYYCKQGKVKWQFIDNKMQIPLVEIKRLKQGKLEPVSLMGRPINPSIISALDDCVVVFPNNSDNLYYFDLDMLSKLENHAWIVNNQRYLGASIEGAPTFAHHLVIGKPSKGLVVDHIDRDRCNNRKNNLRVVTISQNSANTGLLLRNTSGFKGVCWDKNRGKWKAALNNNGKTLNLGRFDSAIDAAVAYDEIAVKTYGRDFVITNKDMGLY